MGCATQQCEQPPLAEQPGREPYAPSWVSTLMGAAAGKLLIAISGAIYFFRGLKSGYLWYDKATETVSVTDPSFASNTPRSTKWGRLAKVVPSSRQVYDADSESCQSQVTQEVASQEIGERTDGLLALINFADCGDVPTDQQADGQSRMDALSVDGLDGCVPADGGFLVGVPSESIKGRFRIITWSWKLMKQFQLSTAQAPVLDPSSATWENAIPLVLIRDGGSDTNPCYRLRTPSRRPAMLPETATKGDILVWDGEKWVASKNAGTGGALHMLDSRQTLFSAHATTGDISVTMPEFPDTDKDVYALLTATIVDTTVGGNTIQIDGVSIISSAVQGVWQVTAKVKKSMTFHHVRTAGSISLAVDGYYY